MRKFLIGLAALLFTSVVAAQTTQYLPARFEAGCAGCGLEATGLLGEFCKTAGVTGNTLTLVCQADDETEYTRTFTPSGSGASITTGTADPTGGADGDAYVQVDASSVVQSIWRNASGTWTEYTLPAGGGTLSDASPENVAAAGSSGTSTDGSRSDHVHDAFSTATPANLGVTAVAGIGAFASRSDHVHRGLSDTDPVDIGTSAAGTRPFASRDDHVHGGGGDANYRGNWVSTGIYARGDEVHNSSRLLDSETRPPGDLAALRGTPITIGIRIVGVETDQATITGSGLGGNADRRPQQWDRPTRRCRMTRLALPSCATMPRSFFAPILRAGRTIRSAGSAAALTR